MKMTEMLKWCKKKKRNPKNSFEIKFHILYHANPELALA